MRNINLDTVRQRVKDALIKINYELDDSFVTLVKKARDNEDNSSSKSILQDIIDNQDIAKEGNIPLCQDTGIVVVFAEIGKDVYFEGNLEDTINTAVKDAYHEGYLRKSVVKHPFDRENTKDNTPAIIHYKLIEGNRLKLKIAAKGAGSENMSKLWMLTPADGYQGVKKVVKQTVLEAGGRACPPIILGIGIGGNFEKSALLAKEAILRDLDDYHSDAQLAQLEKELLDEVNDLGVGPMGIGGKTTCLSVKIETFPMHIASLPVAVNIQCHAARHIEVII